MDNQAIEMRLGFYKRQFRIAIQEHLTWILSENNLTTSEIIDAIRDTYPATDKVDIDGNYCTITMRVPMGEDFFVLEDIIIKLYE
ncbi:MAG: hypothetical protein ACOCP4_04255 [Candidatus Woesearchaeota archaeon]